MVLDTINILGRGMGVQDAPKRKCWGINSIIFERPVDIHFDMHQEGKMKPHQIERRLEVIERANRLNIPVYACDVPPNSTYIRYPIEEVIQRFPTGFFSNGVCYMIALALLKGVNEINFYGVNHSRLDMLGEYTIQKPGVDYWLGVAMGLGVKCNIHGNMSEIGRTFKNEAYGYRLSQEAMVEKYGSKLIGAVPIAAVQ